MNPALFAVAYVAIGATIATFINWHWTRTSGQPLRPVDHAIGFGVATLWPFVTGYLAIGWLIDRLTPSRYP